MRPSSSEIARCFSLLSIAAHVIFFCWPALRSKAVTCFLLVRDQTRMRKSQSILSIWFLPSTRSIDTSFDYLLTKESSASISLTLPIDEVIYVCDAISSSCNCSFLPLILLIKSMTWIVAMIEGTEVSLFVCIYWFNWVSSCSISF